MLVGLKVQISRLPKRVKIFQNSFGLLKQYQIKGVLFNCVFVYKEWKITN